MKNMLSVAVLVAALASTASAGNWWETVKVKGDLRYRHEMIDKEGSDVRNRQRIRARLGVFGEVSQFTKVGLQMATGSADPVSTNQTLGDAFSTKDFRLDLAYFETTHDKLPGFTLIGGKMHNPFFKPGSSELIWDSDWNPEGGVLKYAKKMEQVKIELLGSGFWIEERSKGDDSYLLAAQGILHFDLSDERTSIALTGAYYNYENTQGMEPFFDGDDKGNSVVPDTIWNGTDVEEINMLYANDYDLIEAGIEIGYKTDLIPVKAMFDFVSNTQADSLNTGWLVGLHLGKASKPGKWEARYIYRNVEKDAVVATFADSDFRGGGTDAKGHEFGGGIMLANNTTFNVSYFINQTEIAEGADSDFNRLQVDLQLKF
ncbi:MAG TPA: putative porin [candidate division Zixibacteria bacterium]|mgnify:CR=1 FL=1|nr:putative porin [candidate division Zixibacteria bacterium]